MWDATPEITRAVTHYVTIIATQKLDDKDKQVGIFFDRNRLSPPWLKNLSSPSVSSVDALFIIFRVFSYYYPSFSCFLCTLFMQPFHKVLVRYRYRSCPAFPIASSDIDSDPERTTTPVAVRRAMPFVDTLFLSLFFVNVFGGNAP